MISRRFSFPVFHKACQVTNQACSMERKSSRIRRTQSCQKRADTRPVSRVWRTSKSARLKRTATLVVWETFLELLSFQEPSSHTKRTEGRTEQHYGGTTVRNPLTARAKERSSDKGSRPNKGRNFHVAR